MNTVRYNEEQVEVFETRECKCTHKYKFAKRVNDIQIRDKVYRQIDCEKCGKHKYEIDTNDFHPALLKEVIVISDFYAPTDTGKEVQDNILKSVLDYFDKDTTNVPQELYKEVFNYLYPPTLPVQDTKPIEEGVGDESFLQQLRRLSVERAKNGFKTYENQPITYWTTAIVGEFGELCNMIKKMKRAENGGHDSGHSYTAKDITPKMLREEIGGTLIYIDLLCSFLGIDLEEAIIETFNEKSIELGFPYLLNTTPPPPQEGKVRSAMEWIDVKDRLPEIQIPVLVYMDYGKIDCCKWTGELWLQSVRSQHSNGSVTHWQPLPSQPTKDTSKT